MGYCLNPVAPELNAQCDLLNEDSLREGVANKWCLAFWASHCASHDGVAWCHRLKWIMVTSYIFHCFAY